MGQKIHLTKDQVDEIYKLFTSKAVKDSDFPATDSIGAGDEITILQNALNKRISYSVILQAILDRVAQGIGGKGLSTEDFTTELKNKLIGIESGAEVNILEGVKVNGVDLVIDSNKKVNVLVPDVSQFITNSVDNLLHYYKKSETYTKAEVAEQIANAINGEFVVVNSLPTASSSTLGKIYLVPSSSPEVQNIKDEFITVQNNGNYFWEQIGSTALSLSGVVSYEHAQSLTSQQKTTARNNIGAGTYSKPSNGIPASDLANGVIPTVPEISTDIATDASSNTKTASPKAVKNYVDNHVPTIDEASNAEIDALFV